jgi:hypothetical protein
MMLRAARSAKARATMMSASASGVRVVLSRFSAPMVASRSRSGRASADRNPAWRAAAEKDGQRAGPVAVGIQRSQAHHADPQREREHRPRAGPQHRRGEGGPPAGHRLGQVGLGHRLVLLAGVDARAFSQRVLQILDQPAYLIGGAQGPLWYVTGHEHDPGAVHPEDPRARRAQPGHRPGAVGGGQLSQDPVKPVLGHVSGTIVGSSPACHQRRRADRSPADSFA